MISSRNSVHYPIVLFLIVIIGLIVQACHEQENGKMLDQIEQPTLTDSDISQGSCRCLKGQNRINVKWDGRTFVRTDNEVVCSSKEIVVVVHNDTGDKIELPPHLMFEYYLLKTDTINTGESPIGPGTLPSEMIGRDLNEFNLRINSKDAYDFVVDVKRGLFTYNNTLARPQFSPGWHILKIEFFSGAIVEKIKLKWCGEKLGD